MRSAGIALVCLVATLAAGCCMCAAPYDYCAPTFTGQCGEDCRPHARINSAFSYGGAVCEPGMPEMHGAVTYEDSGELPNPAAAAGPRTTTTAVCWPPGGWPKCWELCPRPVARRNKGSGRTEFPFRSAAPRRTDGQA